jgi:hypothetical protein
MVKTLTFAAAFAVSLGCLSAIESATAQQQTPIGHRQPSASNVPADDSVRGDASLDAQPQPQPQPQPSTKRSRGRRAQNNMDVIMKTPNICSNCSQ